MAKVKLDDTICCFYGPTSNGHIVVKCGKANEICTTEIQHGQEILPIIPVVTPLVANCGECHKLVPSFPGFERFTLVYADDDEN
ncbi:hypothetical protein QUF99_14875 [Bacillus sp. DX4.1]|uniref:hypothetical protein n=1 Tax=Bacillus sp. DX4.1 TaxID=3055867 RepID=UPI00259FE406|nr:hypothetical protein [Bacillus sp. DX4.1]MDM5188553.1 hypothetical protein [Bacillus sp. DX4.1]